MNGISVFLQCEFMIITLHIVFRSDLIRFLADAGWCVTPTELTDSSMSHASIYGIRSVESEYGAQRATVVIM